MWKMAEWAYSHLIVERSLIIPKIKGVAIGVAGAKVNC